MTDHTRVSRLAGNVTITLIVFMAMTRATATTEEKNLDVLMSPTLVPLTRQSVFGGNKFATDILTVQV